MLPLSVMSSDHQLRRVGRWNHILPSATCNHKSRDELLLHCVEGWGGGEHSFEYECPQMNAHVNEISIIVFPVCRTS